MNLLLLFSVLSLVNVIFSTIKSIATIKCGKWLASVINATYYGFYNIVIIYTVADFPLWEKCAVTFLCNIIGVFLVKLVEEKLRKDKLWVFQATIKENNETVAKICQLLKDMDITCVYSEVIKDKLYSMQVFSYNQNESQMIQSIFKNYQLKYCAYETV